MPMGVSLRLISFILRRNSSLERSACCKKMGYTVALAPNHFADDESELTILPILADLEAEHSKFQNVVKLLQTDSMLVIKGFAGK